MGQPDQDEVLAGGNSGEVVRRGDTVLRTAGEWTPAVHRLLRHLESAGMPGVPRVLGVEDDRRERLSFVPGECAQYPLPDHVWGEDVLLDVARLTRRLHDASIGCDRTGPWRSVPVEPSEVICHVDIAPYNVTFDEGGRVVGLIDFDHATPAPRIWDVAHAVYRFAPLTTDPSTDPFTEDERLARVDAFVDAYGWPWTRAEVLAVIVQRLVGLEDHATAESVKQARSDLLEHAALYRRDAAFVRSLIGVV
ncbi:aminoglycoside phosphotransferase family protein [Aestuariimicrobium ganziense]|uniref:aminoglycoside phosphotransferase family protein n=1 Tax=Aestuariimicrobium ganziense TaxID=2773677 RepID=UPI0019459256|nr:aminoglycoside phosphotransferase family protein [Aestuariimicrobium ganziense]